MVSSLYPIRIPAGAASEDPVEYAAEMRCFTDKFVTRAFKRAARKSQQTIATADTNHGYLRVEFPDHWWRGGINILHRSDIEDNTAFQDFCEKVRSLGKTICIEQIHDASTITLPNGKEKIIPAAVTLHIG